MVVNEIRLYGEMEFDEALDESLCEDSFAKLEAVISKVGNSSYIMIFSTCHSLVTTISCIVLAASL